MPEKKDGGGGLRESLPHAAALVDELRAAWGREWVDAALRQGVRLQREHQARVARDGRASADAWLRRLAPTGPTLSVHEKNDGGGGMPHTVGLLPGRQA